MLLTIGTLVFLNSISEFSQIILIYAPSSRPLSILTLEYLFNGDLERAAVLGVLMTAAVAVVALGARSLGLKLGPR
jgi:ABC-type Fe3+ transport system permease subunit